MSLLPVTRHLSIIADQSFIGVLRSIIGIIGITGLIDLCKNIEDSGDEQKNPAPNGRGGTNEGDN